MSDASISRELKPAPSAPGLVVAQCRRVLGDCAGFARAAGQAAFTAPSRRLFGATIGQHLRHTLDHYDAPLRAAAGPIDYDRRERGTPTESDLDAALARIDGLRARLDDVDPGDCLRTVTIKVMLTSGGDEAALESNLARELAFASHHAIHHMAMMAAIADELGAPIPDGFGKAPSTLEHERRRGA